MIKIAATTTARIAALAVVAACPGVVVLPECAGGAGHVQQVCLYLGDDPPRLAVARQQFQPQVVADEEGGRMQAARPP